MCCSRSRAPPLVSIWGPNLSSPLSFSLGSTYPRVYLFLAESSCIRMDVLTREVSCGRARPEDGRCEACPGLPGAWMKQVGKERCPGQWASRGMGGRIRMAKAAAARIRSPAARNPRSDSIRSWFNARARVSVDRRQDTGDDDCVSSPRRCPLSLGALPRPRLTGSPTCLAVTCTRHQVAAAAGWCDRTLGLPPAVSSGPTVTWPHYRAVRRTGLITGPGVLRVTRMNL